ncbi:MAG: peptidylprolyl isomerase [Prevotella sp.]|jgi:peptidyl-prolyl cis-trans isomerase SurA|nr:peptidylprolyl isomerase [Prevotella sp.]MCI1474704.1 peptidylprolyl isomerase [Prevotella sp.]MCI1518815.1 peptidylprolyl isomerase [Prevotella sp.]MCI1550085.1 peptidylprolyl isomerase [Prevotella sp.]MCI1595962.1 peptidylprolyl isomerase [Prevotella sp.]
MKKEQHIFLAFMAFLLLLGIGSYAAQSRQGLRAKAVPGFSLRDSGKTAIPGEVHNAVKVRPTAKKQDSAETVSAPDENSIVDEVIWVVGDEPILKSDVEALRLQGEAEGMKFSGDPDCSIPEQLAVQKLFLHQAALDSIQVSESDVSSGIDQQIDYWEQMIGSKEKLEEYRKESVAQMREEMHDEFRDRQLIQKEREKIVEDVKVTPGQVRTYFRTVPADSIPLVPTEVEVEILTHHPKVTQAEIDRIKARLRDFTDRINKGETTFATLARLYSEDPESARNGGELGYVGRGMLDPSFANVAFNLTDPKKISKIVESEYGYHIIQLIDKRGDKIDVRHILLKPQVSDSAIVKSTEQLDSIERDIKAKKFSFEEAATFLSDDKDTKSNHGLMVNNSQTSRTSRFQMKDLPTEVARVVDTLKIGEISVPFQMIDSKGKTTMAIVKLINRVKGHRASISEDFQVMREVVLNKEREKVLQNWIENKIKHTYIQMNDRYKHCHFQYQGWVR